MSKNRLFLGRKFVLSILLSIASAGAAWSQSATDFSGLWKQDNDSCQPKRSGDATLRIVQGNLEFTVENTMVLLSRGVRHAIQKYTTDGKLTVSTGADGDEFDTTVIWRDSSLAFTIEEHEDGRVLRSKELWSLIEKGQTLERIRERANGEKQILVYRRSPPALK